MRYAAIAMFSLVLSGCVSQRAETVPIAQLANRQVTLTQPQIRAVQDGISQSLKDPYSAIFGNVVAASSPNGAIYVCGEVNAKNSYGGYTGMKPYMGIVGSDQSNPKFVLIAMGGDDIANQYAINSCRKFNVLPA